jgi:hypothetical protein
VSELAQIGFLALLVGIAVPAYFAISQKTKPAPPPEPGVRPLSRGFVAGVQADIAYLNTKGEWPAADLSAADRLRLEVILKAMEQAERLGLDRIGESGQAPDAKIAEGLVLSTEMAAIERQWRQAPAGLVRQGLEDLKAISVGDPAASAALRAFEAEVRAERPECAAVPPGELGLK